MDTLYHFWRQAKPTTRLVMVLFAALVATIVFFAASSVL
jgi:hypothetical protein